MPATVCVVVGPGVVPAGVDAVRTFARRTGLGVFNTWGAKGLFRWDDPTHLGTIGLQEWDVELAGILEADQVVAVGLDPLELGADDLGPRVDVVTPEQLATLDLRDAVTASSRLYTTLRSALLPLYERPGTPAAAAAALAASLPAGGLVCAEPGPVGLWVARALPTVELGSVFVPAAADEGVAVAAARTAAGAGRAVVFATHRPLESEEPFTIQVWGDGSSANAVAVDLSLTSVLIDAAGPVRAWGGRL